VVRGDDGNENSPRSIFEAIRNEHTDHFPQLFKDDPQTFKRMDQNMESYFSLLIRLYTDVEND
jgi:hypothetical protein